MCNSKGCYFPKGKRVCPYCGRNYTPEHRKQVTCGSLTCKKLRRAEMGENRAAFADRVDYYKSVRAGLGWITRRARLTAAEEPNQDSELTNIRNEHGIEAYSEDFR